MQSPKYILHIQELPVPDGVTRRCSVKKSSEKRVKITKKPATMASFYFAKKGCSHKCFSLNFRNFLRTAVLWNTSQRRIQNTVKHLRTSKLKAIKCFSKRLYLKCSTGFLLCLRLVFIRSFIYFTSVRKIICRKLQLYFLINTIWDGKHFVSDKGFWNQFSLKFIYKHVQINRSRKIYTRHHLSIKIWKAA